jgi:hypothetical protein
LTDSFSTQSAKNVRLMVRTLGGLLEASGFAEYQYTPQVYLEYSGPWRSYGWIYAYRQHNDSWQSEWPVMIDTEHADRLNSLRWSDTQGLGDSWIGVAAHRLRPAFNSKSEGAALLRRCGQWHFDSQCGTNHLLQFVQATVAVEILLGDKASSDLVGLGELLANRCAYSLAKTPEERQQLLKEFKQIYDTRSAIVHRGKADLSDDEMKQLWKLRYLGQRLIHNELGLMSGGRVK